MNTRKELLIALVITSIYLVLLHWSMALVSPQEKVSLIWLPSGFLLAALIVVRYRLWPLLLSLVVTSSVLLQLLTGTLPSVAIAIFVSANLVESVGGALFFRYFCGGRQGMQAFSHLTMFLFVCALLFPSLSAFIRAFGITEYIVDLRFSDLYQAWFVSVSLGILFVVPCLIYLTKLGEQVKVKSHKTNLLTLLLFNAVMLCFVMLSSQSSFASSAAIPLIVYLSLPLLCWSAIKFGMLGVSTCAFTFAISALYLTSMGAGPFSLTYGTSIEAVFQLQNYLVASCISALYIAMAIDKLSKVTKKHRSMASRYQTLFNNSPISLWEEDFSDVKTYLDQQVESGVKDIEIWLKAKPERVEHCAKLVEINNINQRTVEMFKAESSTSLLLKLDHIFNLDSLDAFRDEIVALYQGANSFRTEASQRRLDGELFFTSTAVNLVPGFEHNWKKVVVSVEDITERKVIENKLQQAAAVFSNTAEGILIMNLSGDLLQVNEAFCEITGYCLEELQGLNVRAMKFDGRESESFDGIWHTIGEEGYWRGEFWSMKKDGSAFPGLLTLNSVSNSQGEVINYIGVFSDISQIKESEDKLDYLAHHDPLTGLPNRLLLDDRLRQSIKSAVRNRTKLAVVFLDIDRFKLVNDSLGHAAGDELLIIVARRLKSVLRANDTVARLSGDEFTIVIENIDIANIERLMDKIISVFDPDFSLMNNNISASASAGVAIFPEDGIDNETLLKHADAAMFDAKESGRNTYHFYTSELTERAMKTVQIEGALHSAISNNEFYLMYQPQIELNSYKCIGVEALIRWQHPELGLVSPELFIPIAERSGLIRDIGRWVIQRACEQGVQWLEQGVEVGKVAVNVSGYQLQTGDLPEIVESILSDTQFSPNKLEIEVTESFVMRRLDLSIAQLTRLKSLGVEISIDDFGTGYSSLSYLKKLPIDKLKIDQSFIAGIPSDNNDIAITNSIISMARDLDLTTIAEGVETIEQANFLASKGCLQVQGYYFSKPLLGDEIEQKLQEFKKVS